MNNALYTDLATYLQAVSACGVTGCFFNTHQWVFYTK